MSMAQRQFIFSGRKATAKTTSASTKMMEKTDDMTPPLNCIQKQPLYLVFVFQPQNKMR